MRSSPAWNDLLGLALASAAVLTLQVTATRLLSFLIWYHFAFLVLSIAFLGFTAGGFAIVKLGARADPRGWLSALGFAAGLSTLVCFAALARLPLAPHFATDVGSMAVFALAVIVMLLPFAFLGAYICLALSAWSDRIGVLYAVDLTGSALGCSIVVALLDGLGVPAAFFASGLLAFAAGVCTFSPASSQRRRRWPWFVLGAIALAWIAGIGGATNELRPWVYIRSAKPYPRLPREVVGARVSNSLSSVEMFAFPQASKLTLWGLSSRYTGPLPDIVGFAIDGWALTATYKRMAVEGPNSVLEYLPSAMPYRIHPAHDALVIGPGGGLDILNALHYGVSHVTASRSTRSFSTWCSESSPGSPVICFRIRASRCTTPRVATT